MKKFIQVKKLYYNSIKNVYEMSDQDCLINIDKVICITPAPLDAQSIAVFQNKLACHFLMEDGESFYVYGRFSNYEDLVI